MRKGILFLMLVFSVSIFGSNATNQAQGLVSGKVLSANYGNDGQQKLFAVTDKGAFLFVKQGSSFNKFFAKTFKRGEKPYFRSAGLKDIDNNRSLDFFYATTRNGKKYLYVVNTKPRQGKYSFYQVIYSNNSVKKSGNLKLNSSFHKWMSNKVKNLNTNTNRNNSNLHLQKRPPLKVVGGGNNAMTTAAGLVDGRILKAGFYTNQNRTKFLFAITSTQSYLFKKNGSSYNKFFKAKLKNNSKVILKNVGIYDINGNGFGDYYYQIKRNKKTTLFVINTLPRNGKFSIYKVVRKVNGNLAKSGNLQKNSVYHNWMKKKIGGDQAVVPKPVENKPMLSSDYVYLCDISTNGKGGYRTGGNYCGISINDFQGHEIVFQHVYGPVKFIVAHERFKNGNWKVSYKGAMKNLRLSDVSKSGRATHINFAVNGKNERYDRSVTKLRVYKKALSVNMPTEEEAKNILKSKTRFKRNENIINIFVYKENSQMKIAALTNKKIYLLSHINYQWGLNKAEKLRLKKVKLNNQFNGLIDADNDGLKDLYFSTIDKRKGHNLLNLFSVNKSKVYTAYGKMGEAIGDFDPEVEFKFSKNTPKNLHPWFKKMIYKFGFVKKPREISENDPKDAVQLWVRDNGFLNNRELQLRFRMYNGDQDRSFVASTKGIHPTVVTITVNNVLYRAHYKGIVTAYDKNTNKSYIVYVPKTKRNFVSAFASSSNKVFLGTQNDGILVLDNDSNTIKKFKNKKLKNKDIWKIVKKQNHYLVFSDSNKAIKIKARKLER